MEAIKNNVQKLRTQLSITQEQLGKAVGVTRQTVIAIEKGNYTPSVLLAIKLCKFFEKRVEEVFYL